jgi:hypothetical protein
MLPKPGLFAFLLLALGSCTTKEDEARPTATATYLGTVQLYDEAGTLLTDHSGATVSLYDSPGVSALTDANGTFTLPNVPDGPHRLRITKEVSGRQFGTYYTEELRATAPELILPQPVRLGVLSTEVYALSFVADPARAQLIIRGVRYPTRPFSTPSLYHRIFLSPSFGWDGYADVSRSRYTRLRRNNTATGFTDTISYATLAAHDIIGSTFLVAGNDNPRADSCLAPLSLYWPGPTQSPPRFGRSFPSFRGFSSDPMPVILGR